MKTLKTFEFATTGRKGSYEWDKLLDGGIYQLEHGKDFDAKPETVIALARAAAKKAGKKLKASKVEGGVVIQAIAPAAAKAVPAPAAKPPAPTATKEGGAK